MNQEQKRERSGEGALRWLFGRQKQQKGTDKLSPTLLRGGVCAALAFLLGGCALPFSVYPLGVAFLCAATDSLPFCLLGFLIAGFTSGRPIWLYPAACALILTTRLLARVFIDMPSRLGETVRPRALWQHLRGRIFAESLYLRMTSSCIAVFFLSLVSIIGGGFRYYDLFGALFSIAAAPVAVLLYSGFFGIDGTVGERTERLLHHAWGVAITVSVCLALTGMRLLGASLGVLAAFVGVLAVTKRSGFAASTVTALACGACLGLSYVPVFLTISITAYCLMEASPLAASAVSTTVGSLAGYFLGGEEADPLLFLPLVSGGVLFCTALRLAESTSISLIPEKPKPKRPVTPQKTSADDSLERLSDAFFSLSDSVLGLGRHLKTPSRTQLKQLCDDAFDEICPLCPNQSVCWEEKYTVMQETVSRLASALEKTGALAAEDVPNELITLCGLHESVLQEIRTRAVQLSRTRFSEERAEIFALDYGAISRVLRETAATRQEREAPNTAAENAVRERLSVLGFEPISVSILGERGKQIALLLPAPAPDARRLSYLSEQLATCLDTHLSPIRVTEQEDGVLLLCREAPALAWRQGSSFSACEGVCGDALATFRDTENGYFYALLCDGMGAGVEAALTARLASTHLQRLLWAGVRPETALRMLSDLLRLGRNGGGEESSTTVDLLQIDEYTGRSVFFKCGAAPTYVKRGGSIFKLSASTLPLGILKESGVKRIEFELQEGDITVMVSDGIGGEEECLWLLDYLNGTEETDPEVIASFLTEAASAHGSQDDLSALVLTCLPHK